MRHTFFKEVAYVIRGLRKNLGFSIVATITIALGVGACTAIFARSACGVASSRF